LRVVARSRRASTILPGSEISLWEERRDRTRHEAYDNGTQHEPREADDFDGDQDSDRSGNHHGDSDQP
jgi:hypothetical protein